MSIKLLDDEQLKDIVTAAILTHIDPEKREELIKETLKKLLETREKPHPTKSYTTIKYSPLEAAFEEAAKAAARDIMKEQFMEGTPAYDKLREIVIKATSKWVVKTSDKLQEEIVFALTRATANISFGKESRY